MKKTSYLKIIFVLFLIIIFNSDLISQNKILRKPVLANDSNNPVQSIIDVGNITSWVSNNGFHDWRVKSGSWNGSYPNGADAGIIFSEGIVWGGLVYDGKTQKVRVSGNTYISGCKAITRLYRVRPDYKTADLTRDAANYFLKPVEKVTKADIKQLREQYKKDWNEWPADKGAIYEDVDGNGKYDPTIDIPGVPGASQTIFIKYDDSKSITNYGSIPIGLEVMETYWAYSYTGALGNAVFKKVDLIYKGTSDTPANSHIDSMYINQWADTDLGTPTDDYAGCDTTLNLGYTYNSNNNDKIYSSLGMVPPAGGYSILQGVSKFTGNPNDSAIVNLKWRKGYKYVNKWTMSTFIRHAPGGTFVIPSFNYNGALEYFNFMRGKRPEPRYPKGVDFSSNLAVITSHGTYFLPGDPVTGTGLIDGFVDGPSVRSLWLMTGPFTMNLNDTAEVVIALIVGQGESYLNSITKLKENNRKIQKYFDRLQFKMPVIKPPRVEAIPLNNEIVLNWGTNQTNIDSAENFSEENYNFEGYEVYQLPSKTAGIDEGIKIGSFDLVDGVTVVYDTVRDANWVNIPKLQVSGKDNGITRFIKITRDTLRHTVLFDGQTYYFTVVSYAYNKSPILPSHIIRSPVVVTEAIPQTVPPGIRYGSTFGDTLVSLHTGKSEGSLIPIVVDPTKTDGKTYQVTFDTLNRNIVWNLREKITRKIILVNQSNQSGDNNYPIVNGIMPKIISPPKGIKRWSSTGDRWISGFNWGGSQFYGGMDISKKFWKEALPFYNYFPIELRFTGGSGKKTPSEANGWSQGATYRKDKKYAYGGIGWMPFTAWDVSDSLNPRQVNVSFVEDSINGNTNLKWDMGWNGNSFAQQGGNEYIIISNTSYDPTFYNDVNNALIKDNMYFIWPRDRGFHRYLEAPFTISIIPNLINLPGDTFEFTAPVVKNDVDLAKADVNKINVFPNPYYRLQTCRQAESTDYVTFNHLPNNATIRIFDLSGILVKIIKHKPASGQFDRWYLKNNNGYKVASGIYIVYIDMPKLNKIKIVKLAIIQ